MGASKIAVQTVQPWDCVRLLVPQQVRLIENDSKIEWRGVKMKQGKEEEREVSGSLESFLSLADGNAKSVLGFVRRWCPLKIRPVEQGDGWAAEPVEAYVRLANQLRAMQLISERLTYPDGQYQMKTEEQVKLWVTAASGITDASWKSLIGLPGSEYEKELPPVDGSVVTVLGAGTVTNQRQEFARLVTEHLVKPGCIRPVVEWISTDAPTLKLETDCYEEVMRWNVERNLQIEKFQQESIEQGRQQLPASACPLLRARPSRLFSVLALQVIALLASPNDTIPCGICGTYYKPKRLNSTGLNRCPGCRRDNHRRIRRASDQKRSQRKIAELSHVKPQSSASGAGE